MGILSYSTCIKPVVPGEIIGDKEGLVEVSKRPAT